MKRFVWRWLAAASVSALALAARAQTRPQYGGALHVAVHESILSLDPADSAQPESLTRRNVLRLIFEGLVDTDDNGRTRPALASSWEETDGGRRWVFHLREKVVFHDGGPFTSALAASCLRAANPLWTIESSADALIISLDTSNPNLLGDLALSKNFISTKASDGKFSGTGPFQIEEWQPGKRLSLSANENYWAGRPFLDGVEIDFGYSFREQQIMLASRKSDFIEIAPEQSHRLSVASDRLFTSQPVKLLALVFADDPKSPEEKSLRQALALSIERSSIRSVILQGTGAPAGGILPEWMSGYAFAFSSDADLAQAQRLSEQVRATPVWTISYDSSSVIAGLLVERVALNAHEAGLRLQPFKSAKADVRLVEISLPDDPEEALAEVAMISGISRPQIKSNAVEDLYSAEHTMLATQRVIPLFHLPVVYEAATNVQNWRPRSDGMWNLAEAWMMRGAGGTGNP